MPETSPPRLRGLHGDFDMDVIRALWSCGDSATDAGTVREWRLDDDASPAAPGLELTLPDGARLDDPLAAIDALLARSAGWLLPSMAKYAVAGCVTRILIHFIAGGLRRTALHYRWIAGADTGCIEGMARRWLGLPGSAADEPAARTLIDRAVAQLRAYGRQRAESAGAGAQAAHEIGAEWSRLHAMLRQHIESESAVYPSPDGGLDLPGICLAAAVHGGVPLDRSLMERLERGLELDEARPSASLSPDALPESLAPVLQYIAMTYHPLLRVNRACLAEGAPRMSVDLGYGAFDMPCQPAWEAARLTLERDIRALDDQGMACLRHHLGPLGVLAAYGAG